MHKFPIQAEQWLERVMTQRSIAEVTALKSALALYTEETAELREQALGVANILFDLKLDNEILLTALLYPLVQENCFSIDELHETYGETCHKLLDNVLQMQSLNLLAHPEKQQRTHIENLRKMLLAMMSDVRAILLILAERLWLLHSVKQANVEVKQQLARDSLAIYAPLANRLGIWQLKWELEDVCFHYLQPEAYYQLAAALASRRETRENKIQLLIHGLTAMLATAEIADFVVQGRAKHLYSIYNKMQRKQKSIDNIHDISALRVLVSSIEDCYKVLGLIQNTWATLPEEFDDYIATPKANGYRSIHLVIRTPQAEIVEIQIRTHEMHNESELGVAAHWRYKEGILNTSSYEAKIALLRQVMSWEDERIQHVFADRVYVFTPLGDIVDLSKGATPLDFAYHIHSELGHRCRGAKIDGKMVPLTYQLKTGDRVEVLTTKLANPSRDWLNPHRGYLQTARARAKVQHWFKLKDGMPQPTPTVTEKNTVVEAVSAPLNVASTLQTPHIQIQGIDNLLTILARCCKPLPGDDIIGYITRARGMSIHKRNCGNITNASKVRGSRLMEVNWQAKNAMHTVDLHVRIYDRPGILRDLTATLASEKINVQGLQTKKNAVAGIDIYLTVDVTDVAQLQKAFHLLQSVPNVVEVRRR